MNRMRFPVFFFLFLTTVGYSQSGPLLRLQGQESVLPSRFDRSRNLAEQLPAAPTGSPYAWAWLQFERALAGHELEALKSPGIRLHGYVQDHCYYVAIPRDIAGNPLRDLPVYSLSALAPAHIVHPDLAPWLREDAGGSARKLDLTVMPHSGLDPRMLFRELGRAGFSPMEAPDQDDMIRLVIPARRLTVLAEAGLLRHIALTPPPGEPEDRNGRAMHRANLIDREGAGQGLVFNGEGVNVLVRDDGRIGPHLDYLGRLNQDYCEDPEDHGTHGDMVAGILAGAGNINPDVRGMATGAMIFTENYNGNFDAFTESLIKNEDIRVTNSSYSDGCNTGYTGRAVRTDRQIWEDPLLMHVFSAGNAGTSDCDYGAGPFWGNITGGHKAGKNSIATANLFSDFNLAASSSRGPVHDGRIKPDIAAHGQGQLSTYPNHTIDAGGGTSAAAPGVAGVIAQLIQAYRETYNSAEPESALIKAALLNSATDMGARGPDFQYGWGHLNAFQAWQLLQAGQFRKVTLAPGETETTDIEVPAGLHELRVMLYWADPAGLPQAAKALVQDFDLRVTAPGASVPSLPLVLDHSPDPFLLAQPAQPGEDHLNNVEQVRFAQPEAGNYTVSLHGFQLPFGSADAWLVWSFVSEEPAFAFPAGGESLHPGENIRVYWEAPSDTENWSLSFSPDSGQTWVPLSEDIPASRRHADVLLPQSNTDRGFIRLIRGGQAATQDRPLQLFPRPANLRVARACPDSIAFTWNPVEDAAGYLVFQPGDRYMEVMLQTDTALVIIPTWNPLADNWLAVQALDAGELRSPRTPARNHRFGLVQCRQELDTRVSHVVSPANLSVSGCSATPLDLILSLRNDGLQAVNDLPMYYQLENEAPVQAVLAGNFNAGASRFFKFPQPPVFTESGSYSLRIWTDLPGDQFRFNDTLYLRVQASIQNTGNLVPDVLEDFESVDSLPPHWRIQASTEPGRSWQVATIVYPGGGGTRAVVMPNFTFDQIGNQDLLITPQIDLGGSVQPLLSFDLAYSGYFGTGPDTLEVEILADCKEDEAETLWSKTGAALVTSAAGWDSFTPESAEDWRTESIDLSTWAGSKVLVRFRNRAGYGNNLWLDNIRLTESALLAGIATDLDSVCVDKEITFAESSKGGPDHWTWEFGQDAEPSSAEGPGPHTVRYSGPGWKAVLLTVSRSGLSDTTTRWIPVIETPVADFNAVILNDTLWLSTLATGAEQHHWLSPSFGERAGSTLALPREMGWPDSLLITHIAANRCGADTLTRIILVSSVRTEIPVPAWRAWPNPGRGMLFLSGASSGGKVWLEALDLQGRVIWSGLFETSPGPVLLELETAEWPAGTYYLRLSQAGRFQALPVQVE